MMQVVSRAKGALEVHSVPINKSNSCKHTTNIITNTPTKSFTTSKSGNIIAYQTPTHICILSKKANFEADDDNVSFSEICKVDVACLEFCLSSTGAYLAAYQKYQGEGQANLFIYKIQNARKDSSNSSASEKACLWASFEQRNQVGWHPQWTHDEQLMARKAASSILFYRTSDSYSNQSICKEAFRISLPNLESFALGPGMYPKIAIFSRENKQKAQPASTKVFLLPNTGTPMAQKMFFKAHSCRLEWNSKGKALLAVTESEQDETGKSYYGENQLFYVSGDGSFDCRVHLDAKGPIHDVAWSGCANEFCVVYGFMPSKCTIFDARTCEAIHTFPQITSKNHVRYNAQGSLLLFGGFGNLAGDCQIVHRASFKTVGEFKAQGSAICEWSPDGASIVTGIVTPRLRVDNGWKVWGWNGTLLASHEYGELYGVGWLPAPDCKLAQIPSNITSIVNSVPVKKAAYRPPSLRNNASDSKKAAQSPPSTSATNPTLKAQKRVRKLKEKLDQIGDLKAKCADGIILEANQMQKIEREAEIRAEYEDSLVQLSKLE